MNILKTIKRIFPAAVFVVFTAFPVCADSAVVVSLRGKVEVNRNGTWVALSENGLVSQGEVISTGFKSEAVLKYQGATMQLGPLTRVTLETLAKNEKKDSVSLYLNTGAVKSSVKKTENKRVSYTVHNPVAVASVRGTDFSFISTGDITCTGGAVVTYPASYYTPSPQGMPSAGESGAGTPAEDIAPGAPAGSVVVLPGQGVSLTSGGFSSKPADTAAKTAQSVLNTVSTPVNTEGVTTGSSAGTQTTPLIDTGTTNTGTKKGTITVKITVK
ncbi:MAG: FecR domain-containing protein [Treponema sp.]